MLVCRYTCDQDIVVGNDDAALDRRQLARGEQRAALQLVHATPRGDEQLPIVELGVICVLSVCGAAGRSQGEQALTPGEPQAVEGRAQAPVPLDAHVAAAEEAGGVQVAENELDELERQAADEVALQVVELVGQVEQIAGRQVGQTLVDERATLC